MLKESQEARSTRVGQDCSHIARRMQINPFILQYYGGQKAHLDSLRNYWFLRNLVVLELGAHSQWKILGRKKSHLERKWIFRSEYNEWPCLKQRLPTYYFGGVNSNGFSCLSCSGRKDKGMLLCVSEKQESSTILLLFLCLGTMSSTLCSTLQTLSSMRHYQNGQDLWRSCRIKILNSEKFQSDDDDSVDSHTSQHLL